MDPIINYCTLFNSHFLSRGLALYHSLIKHAKTFHLYILAFDQEVYDLLIKMELAQVTIISLAEFETDDLRKVKVQRTLTEYCWTCTPAIILYCIQRYGLSAVCYLDADLFFYSDPNTLLKDQSASVLLTEHRYTKAYDNTALSGKYCVQFMYFKNDIYGLAALHWWREACLNWCYNRTEAGKFGDQKYLDDWLTRFSHVDLINDLGAGVAPWNVQQYHLIKTDDVGGTLYMQEQASQQKFKLIFYHFHALRFVNDKIDCGSYRLKRDVINTIYYPYIRQLLSIEQEWHQNFEVLACLQTLNIHARTHKQWDLKDWLRQLRKRLMGNYHMVPLSQMLR